MKKVRLKNVMLAPQSASSALMLRESAHRGDMAKKAAARKTGAKKETSGRKGGQAVRQAGRRGKFKESDDVGKSLTRDRKKAKRKIESGQRDKGDL